MVFPWTVLDFWIGQKVPNNFKYLLEETKGRSEIFHVIGLLKPYVQNCRTVFNSFEKVFEIIIRYFLPYPEVKHCQGGNLYIFLNVKSQKLRKINFHFAQCNEDHARINNVLIF